MSDIVITAVIGGIATIVVALLGNITKRQKAMEKKQDVIFMNINGRVDQLVELTRQIANAAGRAELKDEQDKEKK